MSFRQTYKGIFQFKDQSTLERAMFENQAEAMGADALGLQDCFHSPGVMLIDIDTTATLQDWEEMAVAIATLAMHAARGFCYALAYDGGETGPRTEYFTASGEELPKTEKLPVPALADDYFPLREGARYRYQVSGMGELVEMTWTVRNIKHGPVTYHYFQDEAIGNVHYNDFWDGTYFRKRGPEIDAVMAGNERELDALDRKDRYAFQAVYSSLSKPGDIHYAIWKEGDHFLQFTVEAFEDLNLPVGKLAACMRVRMDLYHVMGSEMFHEVQHQWFAKGHGLAMWRKGEGSLRLTSRK
jgi:hypothetical protein